jgi:hypothetical protein
MEWRNPRGMPPGEIRMIGSIFRYQQEWFSASTFYPAPERAKSRSEANA